MSERKTVVVSGAAGIVFSDAIAVVKGHREKERRRERADIVLNMGTGASFS